MRWVSTQFARARVTVTGGTALAVCGLLGVGCASGYRADYAVSSLVDQGETSKARVDLAQKADADSAGREKLLYQQQAMHLALLDGIPESASRRVEYVYDMLRTQGLNAGNSSDLFLVNEQGVRFWKGEPYEQAVALCLVSMADMMTERWGNARAAAIESLQRLNAADSSDRAEFVLGRLLAGVANRQLGRAQEATEHFAAARQADPRVGSLADELERGQYNGVLLVEYGSAPVKTAVGEDGAQVAFRPRTGSDARGLVVTDAGGRATWPWVLDLNSMSSDYRWTGRDAGRRNKSTAGTVLTAGGVAVAASSDEPIAQAAGLGAAIVGLIAKSNSRADTRFDDLLPQRMYLVPVRIGTSPPVLALEGGGETLMPLGLRPSESGRASARLVRLPTSSQADKWAESGRVVYANDVTGALSEPTLPWVLGGRCVRTPSRTLISEYYRAGLPETVAYEDLIEFYHAEGIDVLRGQDAFAARGHVLEGGSTLYTPQGGTVGFTRLFGIDHGQYEPRSSDGRAMRMLIQTPTQMREELPR